MGGSGAFLPDHHAPKTVQAPSQNDIYVMMVSWAHSIAAKDKYVAIVSTVVETSKPEEEIQPAINLLGNVLEKFVQISEIRLPVDDGSQDGFYVSATYDPTSHFEET